MSELMIHDDRDTIIAGLREQLRQTREELALERAKGGQVSQGVLALRNALTPLYGALQHIFEESAAMGLADVPSASTSPKNSPAWESWKHRLGGATARAIDALMLHGELNQTQLRIHLGCASRTVTNVVQALNKYQLINRNGGKISLKEL